MSVRIENRGLHLWSTAGSLAAPRGLEAKTRSSTAPLALYGEERLPSTQRWSVWRQHITSSCSELFVVAAARGNRVVKC